MYGKTVHTNAYATLSEANKSSNGTETVAYEARKINANLLKLVNFDL